MTRAPRYRLLALFLGPIVALFGRAAGLPDLALGPARLMLAPGGGEAVLALPVENRGDVEIEREIPVRLGVRDTVDAPWVWEDLSLAPLPPGGCCPVLVRLPLDVSARELAVTVSIDPAAEWPESDKTNNEMTLSSIADLLPPPLLEPVPEACSAGTVTIKGRTGCGWEVEAVAGSTVAANGVSDGDGRFALAVPLAPGPNTIAVRAVIGGIWAGRPAALPPIYCDSTPPILTVDTPVEGAFYRSMTPVFSVTDQLRTEVRLTLDERAYDGAAVEAAGRHVLRVTARDAAGNVSSVARSFHIDREPPALRITGVADGQTVNGPVSPWLTAQDTAIEQAAFWIDGYLWRNGLPLAIPGRHELTAEAQDRAGNRSRLRCVFTITGSRIVGATPATEALTLLLPAGSRLLLAKTGRWTPDPTPASAVFLATRDGAIRLGLVAPGAKEVWLAPGTFGRNNGNGPPDLAIRHLDLEGDGAIEVAAEGPGPDGRRLVLVRWQAGEWSVIGDFGGESLILLAGPAGARRPIVAAEKGGVTGVWARTNFPSGFGPQFRPAPGTAFPAAVMVLGTDPGYAFLRPYPLAAGRAVAPFLLCRAGLGQMVLGLQGGKEGYRLVAIQSEQVIPVSPEAVAGEIGPSWLWPDPDGLFTADFDGDGEAEPYLTVRQGRDWRELLIFDVIDGAVKQVFRGRARLPASGYAPGFSLTRRGEEALIRLGQGAETRFFRWDRSSGSFQPTLEEPDGPAQNLLSRKFLVKADVLADLW